MTNLIISLLFSNYAIANTQFDLMIFKSEEAKSGLTMACASLKKHTELACDFEIQKYYIAKRDKKTLCKFLHTDKHIFLDQIAPNEWFYKSAPTKDCQSVESFNLKKAKDGKWTLTQMHITKSDENKCIYLKATDSTTEYISSDDAAFKVDCDELSLSK